MPATWWYITLSLFTLDLEEFPHSSVIMQNSRAQFRKLQKTLGRVEFIFINILLSVVFLVRKVVMGPFTCRKVEKNDYVFKIK